MNILILILTIDTNLHILFLFIYPIMYQRSSNFYAIRIVSVLRGNFGLWLLSYFDAMKNQLDTRVGLVSGLDSLETKPK